MIDVVFATVLRSIAIPLVVFFFLKETVLGESGAFLAITIAVSAAAAISILWQLIKLVPSSLMLRGNAVTRLVTKIFIELASVAGFWYYFLENYS